MLGPVETSYLNDKGDRVKKQSLGLPCSYPGCQNHAIWICDNKIQKFRGCKKVLCTDHTVKFHSEVKKLSNRVYNWTCHDPRCIQEIRENVQSRNRREKKCVKIKCIVCLTFTTILVAAALVGFYFYYDNCLKEDHLLC